jgi:hypothetical protein
LHGRLPGESAAKVGGKKLPRRKKRGNFGGNLHKQHNQYEQYASYCKVYPFFEDIARWDKHPEGGQDEEQQGRTKENIEEKEWAFRRCFVDLGHFFEYHREFLDLVFGDARAQVEGALFEIDRISFRFFYFKFFDFQFFPQIVQFDAGRDAPFDYFFFFQKIRLTENQDDAAEGIHGHDAGQEEAQVAVVNAQGIPHISVVHTCFLGWL